MKRTVPLLVLLFLFSCTSRDAFSNKRLVFDMNLSQAGGLLNVHGRTNLPDKFKLFFLVEAAPELGSEASWSARSAVAGGGFSIDTLFTDPLPYRVTCILSPTLNPEYAGFFQGEQVPFAFDGPWEYSKLGNDSFQLSLSQTVSIGVASDHAGTLKPALDELREALSTLKKEAANLQSLESEQGGLARFYRLHVDKRRKHSLNSNVTSFYYPKTFERLQRLERYLEQYFLLVLAGRENDAKELENQRKSKSRLNDGIERIEARLTELGSKIPAEMPEK
jgi:hypothetical protein